MGWGGSVRQMPKPGDAGNFRTARLQKPGQFGQPMGGPKPMGAPQLSGGWASPSPSGNMFGSSGSYQNPLQGWGNIAGNPGDRYDAPISPFGTGPSGGLLGLLPAQNGSRAQQSGYAGPSNGSFSGSNGILGLTNGGAGFGGGGALSSGGRGADALGQLEGQFNGGGLTAGPAQPPQMGGGPALGPGDMGPNQYAGLSGSDIFASLFSGSGGGGGAPMGGGFGPRNLGAMQSSANETLARLMGGL